MKSDCFLTYAQSKSQWCIQNGNLKVPYTKQMIHRFGLKKKQRKKQSCGGSSYNPISVCMFPGLSIEKEYEISSHVCVADAKELILSHVSQLSLLSGVFSR